MKATGLVCAVILLAGCSDDGQRPGGAAVDGNWGSTFSSEFVTLHLEGEGNGFTGTAELAPGGVRDTFLVEEGSARGPQISAILAPNGGGERIELTGTVRMDTFEVRLEGGGYRDRRVPLVRIE